MTKAKVLALLIGTALLFIFLTTVSAQRVPPHVFAGTATIDGIRAPDGTTVTAWVDGQQAASTTVSGGSYTVSVDQGDASFAGRTVSFKVGGNDAAQSATLSVGGGDELHLTAATALATGTVFADVIANNDNLVRVWRYSNTTQGWAFFDPRPFFRAFNTLKETATRDIVWVNVKVQQTFQGKTLFPGWNLISVEPLPTSTPTPTPTPTPTLAPVAGFLLYLNGIPVLPGQVAVPVPGGTVTLLQLPQSNGTYVPGSVVSMVAAPRVEGSGLTWFGVDSHSGIQATVRMTGERLVRVDIVPSLAAPTPTPTPVPTPGPTPTPAPTPRPFPPGVPTPTPTPTPTSGRITFMSIRDGQWQVWVMDANGSGQTKLTTTGGSDPAWSPDGTKIAYDTGGLGNSDIYQMNSDGSNKINLSNYPGDDNLPDWSPDGTKLVFRSYRDNNYEIYVMNSDGSNQTRLTTNRALDNDPAWSPDGSKIVFSSDRDIYVMNADGGGRTPLASHSANDDQPAWSPDGTKIAFASDRDGQVGAFDIFVMHADGSGVVRLTRDGANNGYPAWSPDGSKIAFQSLRDGNLEIYVVNPDGSNPVNLTNNLSADGHPDWRPFPIPAAMPAPTPGPTPTPTPTPTPAPTPSLPPLSGKIAFHSTRDGNRSIYIMNANGTNVTRLTNTSGCDYCDYQPSLSPDGSRVAFVSDRDGNQELYVMNVDGSGQTRLSFIDPTPGRSNWNLNPDWSPDGRKVVFDNLPRGIHTINVDGTNLTSLGVIGDDPAWSPDGTKIALTQGGTPGRLVVMNADGSNLTTISEPVLDEAGPDWSPDGTKIAFVTAAPHVIAVVNANGTNRVNLTSVWAVTPSWSPDGTKIVYGGADGVYVTNSDGTDAQRIIGNASHPSWSP